MSFFILKMTEDFFSIHVHRWIKMLKRTKKNKVTTDKFRAALTFQYFKFYDFCFLLEISVQYSRLAEKILLSWYVKSYFLTVPTPSGFHNNWTNPEKP